MFRTRFAELLEAVATMVAELDREEPAVEERTPELRGVEHLVTVSRQRESSVVQPMHAYTILFAERGREPAKSETALSSPVEIPSLRQCLTFVK
ncbi:unnamed protein product [Lampetra fluviatilis]